MHPAFSIAKSLDKTRAIITFFVLILSSGFAFAQNQTEFGADNRKQREMVRAFEAYAVFKMGQYEAAFEQFLSLAQARNVQGMINIANMYDQGLGTAVSQQQASHWYQQAAEAGSAIAMTEIAERLASGKGIAKDESAAAYWRKRAQQDQVPEIAAPDLSMQADQNVLDQFSRVRAALSQFIQEAQNKSISTLTMIDTHTKINLTLPGTTTSQNISIDDLSQLWQAGVDRPGHYTITRSDLQLSPLQTNRIKANSQLLETWATSKAEMKQAYQLAIEEELIFEISEDSLKVIELNWVLREQ